MFLLISINIFLMLSLLSILLDTRLPKTIPYIYQIAALIGFGQLLISREFFLIFNEYTRFWYCFIFMLVAVINTIAINIYLAVSKRLWTLAKFWSGVIVFPTIFISTFFVSSYVSTMASNFVMLQQILLIVFALAIGAGIGVSVNFANIKNILKNVDETEVK